MVESNPSDDTLHCKMVPEWCTGAKGRVVNWCWVGEWWMAGYGWRAMGSSGYRCWWEVGGCMVSGGMQDG